MKLRGVFAPLRLDNDILELLPPHCGGDPTPARLVAAFWVVVLRAMQRRRRSVGPPRVGLRRP